MPFSSSRPPRSAWSFICPLASLPAFLESTTVFHLEIPSFSLSHLTVHSSHATTHRTWLFQQLLLECAWILRTHIHWGARIFCLAGWSGIRNYFGEKIRHFRKCWINLVVYTICHWHGILPCRSVCRKIFLWLDHQLQMGSFFQSCLESPRPSRPWDLLRAMKTRTPQVLSLQGSREGIFFFLTSFWYCENHSGRK